MADEKKGKGRNGPDCAKDLSLETSGYQSICSLRHLLIMLIGSSDNIQPGILQSSGIIMRKC